MDNRAGTAEILVVDDNPANLMAIEAALGDLGARVVRVSLSVDPPVRHARPSIDVLFESVADAYGPAAVAVVLTGRTEKGAQAPVRVERVPDAFLPVAAQARRP